MGHRQRVINISTSTLRLSLESLRQQKKLVAFDANIQKQYGIGTPHAVNSAAKFDALVLAIAEIEAALKGGKSS